MNAWLATHSCFFFLVGLQISFLVCLAVSRYLGFWGDTRRRRIQVADELLRIHERLLEEPDDEDSIQKFRKALYSNYVFERFFALDTLGKLYELLQSRQEMTTQMDDLLKACEDALKCNNPFVRNAAAQALSRVGTKANFAIETLAHTMRSYPHEGAGMYSAIALRNIGEQPTVVLDALRWIINHVPKSLTYSAAQTTYEQLSGENYNTNTGFDPEIYFSPEDNAYRLRTEQEAYYLRDYLIYENLTIDKSPNLSRLLLRPMYRIITYVLTIYYRWFSDKKIITYYAAPDNSYYGTVYTNPRGQFVSVLGEAERGVRTIQSLLSP
jgi:hypothetical protein